MIDKVIRRLPDLKERFPHEYIIDIETTGLNKEKDLIICLGIADLDKLVTTIYFLDEPTKWRDFQAFCRKKVIELLKRGKVWAYNCNFEMKFLQVKGIQELLCYTKGIGFRMTLACASDDIAWEHKLDIKDEDPISGSDVPQLYMREWAIKRDENAKRLIINHNYYDLVKEYIVRYHIAQIAKRLQNVLLEMHVIPAILSYNLSTYI